jgi:hypothetical protein
MFAQTLVVSLLTVILAASGAGAQEPKQAASLPDLPIDVFAPAARATIAEAKAHQSAAKARFAKAAEFFRDLLAKWSDKAISPLEACRELAAVTGEVTAGAKLHAEAARLLGEIENAIAPQVKPERRRALIEPPPEDPMLAWIIAQDGTGVPEAAVAQDQDTKTRIARK